MTTDNAPDFDQIARRVFVITDGNVATIAHILREVWNARGAADIAQVNAAYLTAPLDQVIDAIKAQDR